MIKDTIYRQAAIDAFEDTTYTKNEIRRRITELPSAQPEQRWIPCSERLPEEKDSIYAKYYGTDKWKNIMFRKRSETVLVTVEFPDGKRTTDTSHTKDGEWWITVSVIPQKVIAWKPLPEPYAGEGEEWTQARS